MPAKQFDYESQKNNITSLCMTTLEMLRGYDYLSKINQIFESDPSFFIFLIILLSLLGVSILFLLTQAVLLHKRGKIPKIFKWSLKKFNSKSTTLLAVVVLIGISIRIAFMPFTMHPDHLSSYWRANEAIRNEVAITNTKESLSELVFITNIKVLELTGIIDNFDEIYPEDWGYEGTFGTTRVVDWQDTASNKTVYRLLFFQKLPFLMFEMGAFFVALKLFTKLPQKLFFTMLFWLNFYSVYSSYMYGRHETFALLFIISSLFLLKEGKYSLSAFMISIASLLRFTYIILIPVWIISYINGSKSKIGIKPFYSFLIVPIVHFISSKYGYYAVINRTPELTDSRLFAPDTKLVSGQISGTSLFVLLVVFMLCYYLFSNQIIKKRSQWKFAAISFAVTYCLFFMTNGYSSHYFAWLFYMLILALPLLTKLENWKKYLIFYSLQLVAISIFLILTDVATLSTGLFAPISVSLIGTYPKDRFIHTLQLVLSRWDAASLLALFKGVLVGILLYITTQFVKVVNNFTE